VITYKGYIYVADKTKNRILRFDSNGNWSGSIELPNEKYDDVLLTVDGDDNLYVALRGSEFFVGIYRLPAGADNLMKFSLKGQQPRAGDRLVGFFASRRGRLYLSTFPAEVLRSNWENMTFVYTLSGDFLGMVDYSLEGSKGDAYKVEYKDGNNMLSKYRLNASSIRPTKLLEKVGSVAFEPREPRLHRWTKEDFYLTGIDSLSRVYLSSQVSTRRYNANLELESEIPTSFEMLEKKDGITLGHRSIRISPSGRVYAYGIKGVKDSKWRYNESEVTFVVLRFKETKR
jgi:hypothetical protein